MATPAHLRRGHFNISATERIVFGEPLEEAIVAEAKRYGASRVFVTSTRSLARLGSSPLQRAERALGAMHVGTHADRDELFVAGHVDGVREPGPCRNRGQPDRQQQPPRQCPEADPPRTGEPGRVHRVAEGQGRASRRRGASSAAVARSINRESREGSHDPSMDYGPGSGDLNGSRRHAGRPEVPVQPATSADVTDARPAPGRRVSALALEASRS